MIKTTFLVWRAQHIWRIAPLKPKLLTGQRKLCLFWPTFSHGVPGLSDFLLQKQYGLFRANKARLVGELSLQITDIVSSYAEAEHKPGTDWGSGCEGGQWSPDAELMQCCSQSTSPHQSPSHCSDCGNTVPASPGHGSLELAPPKHQTEVITGAWSLLSIDIGNAVKIISTSTTGSPFPVTVKLQRPVHCHPARLCGVCCVTSHMYNIWNNVTWWDNRLLCRCCPPAPLYWSIKIYSIHCMQHWRGGAGGEAMSTLSKARIM